MKGSRVSNLKFDPNKEKIIDCSGCGEPIVVGKFSKINQKCAKCKAVPKGKEEKAKPKEDRPVRKIVKPVQRKNKDNGKDASDIGKFAADVTRLMNGLDFEIDNQRRYKKKYALNGGGVMIVYPYIGPQIGDKPPRVEYFSTIIQRVVGVNENFREFMPPDAASDCELIAAELADVVEIQPQIGQNVCDSCGAVTSEFGVDPKRGKVLCVKPNNCFKKAFTSAGAEAQE
jgi:hypothetical protein